jgi:hypothetical protein
MVSSTVDHMVAVTVFLAATLLFIGLFNQTIQTAVIYQRHRATATKASDLLDSMLLSPGIPVNWGQSDVAPTGFGLQDPEFTQYKLSPFSLMRLRSSTGTPVYYEKTGLTYSNVTMGFTNYLLVPYTTAINYSMATKLLGIDNTYGFQLTLTPLITVSVAEDQTNSPLRLSVNVAGPGGPLAYASVSYCFITVLLSGGEGAYPSYTARYGSVYTDEKGSASVEFADVTDENLSYAFIAYAGLGGLTGVGFHQRVSPGNQNVVPFIDDFSENRVLIAHSYDVQYFGPPVYELKYNATFVILTEDFTLREVPLSDGTGKTVYGEGKPYGVVTIPTDNPGILIITYRKNPNEGGVVMMPWGLSSMAFPITFGGDPSQQEWVATDMRQVTVGGIAYQAKIALWSLEGYQVID